ncbi:LPS O-antigen chain length determinant protein WzzB [Pseudomonas cichorii]|uniref:LPS O-antigen chain length determinant protein WzzB n=1 Tax=Pseudomonas cichorii TaxID=36746 RepID=UPI0018E63E29|nr:Wzz/FepE/Etk N-terminal domain-containing protein [Pseudomonas cichorii]MBI6853123.1 LPS O-antigen chain length determinant protein WzzB [Pseudomonas cichorii]
MSSERKCQSNDEVDFFELMREIWQQKLLVGIVSALLTGLAIIYVFLVTPVYEAKLFIQSPSQNDIAPLNYGRGSELPVLSASDIYTVFSRTLVSESARREFFNTTFLPQLSEKEREGSRNELYSAFNRLLSVNVVSKDALQRYVITAQSSSPERAVEWVSGYAELVAKRVTQDVIQSAKGEAELKARSLEYRISGAKDVARKQRDDQVVRLKEALAVAETMGLNKPVISSSIDLSALVYMRGTEALQAEIKNLEVRLSDDPFITDLRLQQEGLRFYRDLKIDPSLIKVYRQDGEAQLPDRPIKPQKLMIVLLGAVLGIFLGCGLALIRGFLRSRLSRMS